MESTLIDLMNGELRAHHAYLQAAAWAADQGMDGATKFLLHHAAEELEHMHRFFSYLRELGAKVVFHDLSSKHVNPTNVRNLFVNVAEQERLVTYAIHRATDAARQEGDHRTFAGEFVYPVPRRLGHQ